MALGVRVLVMRTESEEIAREIPRARRIALKHVRNLKEFVVMRKYIHRDDQGMMALLEELGNLCDFETHQLRTLTKKKAPRLVEIPVDQAVLYDHCPRPSELEEVAKRNHWM